MTTSNEKIVEQFRSLDSSKTLEFPSDFDRRLLEQKVNKFKMVLEKILGTSLLLDDSVEDASFFADLILEEKNVNGTICRFSVRFSNFGFMATLPMEGYEEESEVVSAIIDSDFLYVPTELIDEEYDGAFNDKEMIPTWGVRFFDYF